MTPAQNQALRRAAQLVASGHSDQAAPLLASLAQELEQANRPRWAANIHAQASHAYADSQSEQPSLDQARAALKLFLQYQMLRRAPVFYSNITRKMVRNGLGHAAEVLKSEFGSQIGAMPLPAPPAGAQSARLPTNCPKCGAPVHSAEANWIDPNTVECDFCGSQIRPE